jgi:hypothetical protein
MLSLSAEAAGPSRTKLPRTLRVHLPFMEDEW